MIEREGDVRVSQRRVEWAPWSPAQFVALGIGVIFVILGAVSLASTGLDFGRYPLPHSSVAGFHHTPVLGVIELVFGLLMLMAGAVPGASRGMMTFLGIVALGLGIVLLIQPATFHDVLGVHSASGWLYVVTGAVSFIAAMAAPIIFGRDRVSAARQSDAVYRN